MCQCHLPLGASAGAAAGGGAAGAVGILREARFETPGKVAGLVPPSSIA